MFWKSKKTINEQMQEIESKLKYEKLKKEMRDFEQQRIWDLKKKQEEYKKLKRENSPVTPYVDFGKKVGKGFMSGINKIQEHQRKQAELIKKQQKKKPKQNYDPFAW